MAKTTLQNLGTITRETRGTKGLREAAKEIGTSPATLSRIEGGKLPDISTFAKLCQWLKIDPSELMGIESSSVPKTATAHLRAKKEISPETARALANVIVKAQQMLHDFEEDEVGEGI